MKRIYRAAILLSCLCILLLTACSNSDPKVVVSLDKITAAAGETVEIPVKISAGSNVAATDIIVKFDSSLDYVSYSDGEDFSPNGCIGNLMEDGSFKYSLITLSPLTEAGTIFTLKLQLAQDAAGEIPLTLEVPTLVDSEGAKIPVDAVKGSIQVQ